MKTRRRLLSLGLLAALMAAASILAGCAATRGKHAASHSIVTFNLYHDKADWPQRRVLIVDELRALVQQLSTQGK